jgi:flavin-dependent dehydrogenase
MSRRCLDELLLARAAQLGANVRRGVRARSFDGGTGQVLLDGDDAVSADALFLATASTSCAASPAPFPPHAGRGR